MTTMYPSSGPERRHAQRLNAEMELLLRLPDGHLADDQPSDTIGRVVELSFRGAFVHTPRLLDPGTAVELTIQLPSSGELVSIGAEVVWAGEHPDKGVGMGLVWYADAA
ncbi:MAG: PilZ domain-containing protein [Deltaproteobacteria bacterium]|nr:PilZ domain-containing protein [Deltaproteobacteria bacterium]